MGMVRLLKKHGGLIFTVAMILLGFFDLIGLLPSSLDLLDKVLTSGLLLFFWWRLKLTGFMFGKDRKWPNVVVLVIFYILVLPTFIGFTPVGQGAQIYEDLTLPLQGQEFIYNGQDMFYELGMPYDMYLAVARDEAVTAKQYNIALNNYFLKSKIEMWTLLIGMLAIFAFAIIYALRKRYGERSVFHSLVTLFDHNKKHWHKVSGVKSGFLSALIKIMLTYFILFIVSQYFFGLINQWFIVSLDKSLFIVAIIFAIKDLDKSKSKALKSIGSIDDLILGKVRDLFTSTKHIFLGFGFLLIFHYLSDFATYILPYVFGVAKDPFYFCKLTGEICQAGNVVSSAMHQPLKMLVSSGIGLFLGVVSSVGLIALLLFPIIVAFFIVFKLNLKKVVHNKFYVGVIILFFTTTIAYFLVPWITQKSILVHTAGIYGVDFVTKPVLDAAIFSPKISILLIVIIFFLSFFSWVRKIGKYLTTILFLIASIFLGLFVWNYFISSFTNYWPIMVQAFKHPALMGSNLTSSLAVSSFLGVVTALTLLTLLVLDLLFYLGGFVLFVYSASSYMIDNVVEDLISNASIIIWSLIILLIPMAYILFLERTGSLSIFLSLIMVLATFLVFTVALWKKMVGKEVRDDFLLSVLVTVFVYIILSIIGFFLASFNIISLDTFNFIVPVVMIVVFFIFMKIFKMTISFAIKYIDVVRFIEVFFIGLAFALLFYIINEPSGFITLPAWPLLILFAALIAFAEELIFRFIILRMAEKAFGYRLGLVVQALIFALIHYISLSLIWKHYMQNGIRFFGLWIVNGFPILFFVYFVALFMFGLVAGHYVGKSTGKAAFRGNIVYAILIHFIANAGMLLMSLM
ncbi:hypothetical protein DRJ17_01490 [Candidatus Woesearchaeota archaeon]|nr:MAG: hypothetical protein DRJ17_01490 [Candidatus Woesearchaeota archaeon]